MIFRFDLLYSTAAVQIGMAVCFGPMCRRILFFSHKILLRDEHMTCLNLYVIRRITVLQYFFHELNFLIFYSVDTSECIF